VKSSQLALSQAMHDMHVQCKSSRQHFEETHDEGENNVASNGEVTPTTKSVLLLLQETGTRINSASVAGSATGLDLSALFFLFLFQNLLSFPSVRMATATRQSEREEIYPRPWHWLSLRIWLN
jgi:hypothetical protein